MRKSVVDITQAKGGTPLVCLTAYTARVAQILDQHCDLMLVGDSMAMVLYGMDDTLGADLPMMIRHGQAVVRSSENALVVVDMPFGTYQASPEQAFTNGAQIMKETGCQAIKLEGGVEMADTVAFLTRRGVPVMGHVGLRPQAVNTLGGYKSRGHDTKEANQIIGDAKAIADAGAFAIVVEGVSEPLAAIITDAISVPTIGIGASAACDGQILVTEDMMGITDGKKPKFVKPYANVSPIMEDAVANYAKEVKERTFPSSDFVYHPKKKSA